MLPHPLKYELINQISKVIINNTLNYWKIIVGKVDVYHFILENIEE